MSKPYDIDIDKRLKYLEQANFYKMMALDLSRELGEFHSSISQLKDPGTIFENCQVRARRIIGFKQISFFLVNEDDSEFYPYSFYPDSGKDFFKQEIEVLVEDGTFSRAVFEKRPVTAYSTDFNQQMLLHVLATSSRVRGMFAGVLEKKSKHIQEASFELFSILMTHCANALESWELYHQLRESNDRLKEKVNQLFQSEACLKEEIVEHKKTETALEASEKQYRLLAETAREMILVISKENKISYANPSALATCGYEKQEMIDLPVSELIEDAVPLIAHSPGADHLPETTYMKSKHGRMIPTEINIVPITNKKGISGYLVIGRDISARLQAEQNQKDLEIKLWQTQKMESIGLLASGIAHDFNNILGVIANYTSLSISRTDPDDSICDYLHKVRKATDRAIRLARNLYTIGRNDEHHKAEINIVSTIRDTVDLLATSLGKQVNLETCFSLSRLFVLAEETRIQQVLMNLISNAGYELAGKGTIRVCADRVTFHKKNALSMMDLTPGDYIKISVIDDGPGMDSTVLQRIFEPYFSTKTGKDNSGLGLAVVHGIVKNYKGGIDVESRPGKGTGFHIYLPEFKPGL